MDRGAAGVLILCAKEAAANLLAWPLVADMHRMKATAVFGIEAILRISEPGAPLTRDLPARWQPLGGHLQTASIAAGGPRTGATSHD